MVPPGRWFTHSFLLALKLLTAYVHRSTLPQSRIRSTAPSEREPGWAGAIQRAGRKPQGCGRFSSPLRNSKTVSLYHSTGDTPSVSLSLDSSLREGAGNDGAVPFIGVLAKVPGYGRFSSPLRNSKDFGFHHSTGHSPRNSHSAIQKMGLTKWSIDDRLSIEVDRL